MKKYEKYIKKLKKETGHFQLNAVTNENCELNFEGKSIKNFRHGNSTDFFLKVYIGKREGSSYSSVLDDNLINNAIKTAENSPEKEYFYGLPKPRSYRFKSGQDAKLRNMDIKDMVNISKRIIKKINKKKVILNSGSLILNKSKIRLINSNNIDVTDEGLNFGVNIEASSSDSISDYEDYYFDNKFFDAGKTADNVNRKVMEFLKASGLNKKADVVIIRPKALVSLLNYGFLPNLRGDNYEKNKSLFSGKMNKKILDKNITIIDDNSLKGGINSEKCDYEGTPSMKTVLISKGILKNVIFDYNTALHNNKKSTSNSSLFGIDFSNVIIKGDNIKEPDNAIIIDTIMGAHTSDSITTDFSVHVQKAYLKDKDKLIPVTDFMISGSVTDLLNKSVGFAGKEEQREGIYTKSLVTEGVNVIV
ncbi:TldD/PmbA family protein [Candidatus Woesearchaeota archaeon]|nr:TldD/PmbA family protein [Candidatus Woesearchaeota archaeon]